MSHKPDAIESDAPPDAGLVRAAVRDVAAFEPLYRRSADRVYRYGIRRLDDHDPAADATSAIII